MSTSALYATPVATANSRMFVKPEPASQNSESHIPLCDAQESVLKIHEHLVDISRLFLNQENEYLKQQLIPQYERNLKHQEEINLEAQILAKGLETKLLVLEKVSGDEQQRHARALEAATSLLNTQIQKIRDLKKEIEQHSVTGERRGVHVHCRAAEDR